MAIRSPYRVHQTTPTSGVGAYALTTATPNFENFRDRYVTGQVVPYVATDNVTGYEIGFGTLTFGTPDTITRSTIVLSSSGSTNAVNWASGSKDIFAYEAASAQYPALVSGATTLGPQDWGTVSIYTGAGGDTWQLPALSAMPSGFVFPVMHAGQGVLSFAASGADTFLGGQPLKMLSLESSSIVATASGWSAPSAVSRQEAQSLIFST